jgi:hypothetical protein
VSDRTASTLLPPDHTVQLADSTAHHFPDPARGFPRRCSPYPLQSRRTEENSVFTATLLLSFAAHSSALAAGCRHQAAEPRRRCCCRCFAPAQDAAPLLIAGPNSSLRQAPLRLTAGLLLGFSGERTLLPKLIFSGRTVKYLSSMRKNLGPGVDGWAISLKAMTSIVVALGLVITGFYWGVAATITPTVLFLTGVGFFSLILFGEPFTPLMTMFGMMLLLAAVYDGAMQNIFSKSANHRCPLLRPTFEFSLCCTHLQLQHHTSGVCGNAPTAQPPGALLYALCKLPPCWPQGVWQNT